MSTPTIPPESLDDRLGDDAVSVLDVRPSDSFADDHLDGSVNAPVDAAVRNGHPGAVDRYLDAVPPDGAVVTVCETGVLARRVAAHLRDAGYDARALAGGMRRWRGYRTGTLGYRARSFVRRLLA